MDLQVAVATSHLEKVREFLKNEQLEPSYASYELLRVALGKEDFVIYQELVRNGAPITGYEVYGQDTLLHLLAKVKNFPYSRRRDLTVRSITRQLLDCAANVLSLNENNETPIHVAAKCRSVKILYLFVDELMKNPERIWNIIDQDGLSLFHIICMLPHSEYVAIFYNSMRLTDNKCINDAVSCTSAFCPGYTALHFAAAHYRLGVVKLLIDQGADPTALTAKCLTLLHLSCMMHRPDWMFHEISREVPVNQIEDWASNVLDNLDVTLQIRTNLVDYLLDSEMVGVNARDLYDHNAMFFVAASDYFARHEAIIPLTKARQLREQINTAQHYIQVKLKKHQMKLLTTLFVSSMKQINQAAPAFESKYFYELVLNENPHLTCEMVQFLLKISAAGANITDENCLTPLHLAVKKQNLVMAECCLQFYDYDYSKMANVNLRDDNGNTPLLYIDSRNTSELNSYLVILLLKHGSDVNLRSEKGAAGFYLLYTFFTSVTYVDNFNNIADDERGKIAAALACKTDIGVFKCNIWVETLITIWKYLIMLESCDAPLQSHHEELLNQLEDSIFLSKKCCKGGSNFKKHCEAEVVELRRLHISKFTCLNHILTRNIHEVGLFAKSEVLANIIKSRELDARFPIYSKMLRARYISGLARKKLTNEAAISLQSMISQYIPWVCFHKILSFLSDKKLIDIKEAGKNAVKLKFTLTIE